jgi:uncharacterized membrane protein YjjP (DUF1212 family)
MISKKYSEVLFIAIMGLGMSFIMTLAITYINTGLDSDFLNRWFKAWLAGFPIAVVAAAVIAPIAKKLTKKFTS